MRVNKHITIYRESEEPLTERIENEVVYTGHPEYLNAMMECIVICATKNIDYTGGAEFDDPLANFKRVHELGIDPVDGILIRMLDKWQRIISFKKNGKMAVENESLEDALKDLINYQALLIALLREQSKVNSTNQDKDL